MKIRVIFLFFLICSLSLSAQNESSAKETDYKLSQTLDVIRRFYVEKVDLGKIVEKGVVNMLLELDPHSVYISAKDVEKSNEPLVGNFDGIGVSFQILKDTINIIDVISRGPSEKVGILPGDKIISIDSKPAVGDTITNTYVYTNLRGKKGTVVELGILRMGMNEPLIFRITRDKIPLYSIDTYFMVDAEIGYIRLDRFSRTSTDEFKEAMKDLNSKGMKKMILDLRGNGGGYLDIAVELTNIFLEKGKMIVYTEGVSSKRQDFLSTSDGSFKEGRLVVLIDEGSASASEILSGAIQDWDRGIVVGRRSFGKGLVQKPFNLADNSQIRLTVSRYYTPSGRCIQKPYSDGVDSYYQDYVRRMNHKELVTPDSIKFPDSLKYHTTSKRIVFGGGGIMPDVFVPIDTVRASDYLIELRSKGLLNNFTVEWSNQNRELTKKYPSFSSFDSAYSSLGIDQQFEKYVSDAGVSRNKIKTEWIQNWLNETAKKDLSDSTKNNFSTYSDCVMELLNNSSFKDELQKKAKEEDEKSNDRLQKSEKYLTYQIKAMIARNLYGIRYYYDVMKDVDEGFQKAMEVIQNDALYQQLKIETTSKKGKK